MSLQFDHIEWKETPTRKENAAGGDDEKQYLFRDVQLSNSWFKWS